MKERVWDFQEVGRLPLPGDNVAMATRRLEAGTRVSYEDSEFTVGHTVLEGHRFAVEPVAEGEDLLSWGLRFGRAIKDIAPGDYACNEKILRVLRERTGFPQRGEDEDRDLRPGRPEAARRAELPRCRTRTLRPRRGAFPARPAGTPPRRAAHLHGLPAWCG